MGWEVFPLLYSRKMYVEWVSLFLFGIYFMGVDSLFTSLLLQRKFVFHKAESLIVR